MTTPTTTPDTDKTEKLLAFHAEMQELHNLTEANRTAPTEELKKLNGALTAELSALSVEHSKAQAQLEEQMRLLMEQQRLERIEAENKDKARREELQKSLDTINIHFKSETKRIIAAASPLLEGMSLTEIVALIPEDARPNLIETVDHPGKKMFILQHKLAPECGFVIWADEGGTTRYSLNIRNLLVETERRLVCFCDSGCMTTLERDWHTTSLAKTCVEHGITTLYGRRIHEEKDGVVICDGDGFYEVAQKFPKTPPTHRASYFVSLHG